MSTEINISGNVHARTIKDLAEKYGFSFTTNPRLTNNGRALEVVKNKRNDLAHGVFSFQAVGKGYTEKELIKMKKNRIGTETAPDPASGGQVLTITAT